VSALRALAGIAFGFMAAGCGGGDAPGALTLAAASDLAGVIEALTPEIERACDTRVVATFGSSGQLRDQVRAGAPYDLYLSADRAYPRDLEAAGALEAGSVVDYATGRLALVTRSGLLPVEAVGALGRADLRWIAMANPAHAPYGRAAREALEGAGAWSAVESRIVMAENVRQAVEYVRSGDADAGLVALALVVGTDATFRLVPADLHAPIVQSGGVVAGARSARAARCALALLAGDGGRDVLTRFGFEPVAPS
jgi:molybdate transport system substrate-binding protein